MRISIHIILPGYWFTCCLWLLIMFVLVKEGQAQHKFSVSGYVKDAETGEDLIGASVFAPQLSKGTTTNAYGYFSLSLPTDSIQLVISYIGYETAQRKVFLSKSQQLTI